MNPLLQRQLRKYVADQSATDPAWADLLAAVEKTYAEQEENIKFLSHTLEVASQELTEANERLRLEAENRVRRISNYFEQTLDLQPNIIFRCKKIGGDFQILLARGSLLSRLGLERMLLEKGRIQQLISEPAKQALFEQAWQGHDQRFALTFTALDVVCQVSLHALREDGLVVELIGIIADVSLQKVAEDKLRQTSEDLARRAAELEQSRRVMLSMIEDLDQSRVQIERERDRANAMALQAATASRAKSDFLASMSHEIRTPMNIILGNTQLLNEDANLSREAKNKITTINRSGEHLLAILNNILDLAKIEAGQLAVQVGEFNLLQLADDLALLFRPAAEAKNLSLRCNWPELAHPFIRADEGKIRQVLVNLLGNAVKFTRTGYVEFSLTLDCLTETTAQLCLTVKDTGPGIAPEEFPQLFQKFGQTSSGKKLTGGTGLGLAISKRYAQLLRGEIQVTSQPELGSTFRFILPVELSTAPLIQPASATPIRWPAPGDHWRILVVDDVVENRDFLVETLKLSGVQTRVAASGREALALCSNWRPHLVLMDTQMPEMNGFETISHLRSDSSQAELKIISVSATAYPEDQATARLVGANDFIAKPVQLGELFGKIGQLLGRQVGGEAVIESTSAKSPAELAANLAAWPTAIRSALRRALVVADYQRVHELIATAAQDDPETARQLADLADRFDSESILRLLAFRPE